MGVLYGNHQLYSQRPPMSQYDHLKKKILTVPPEGSVDFWFVSQGNYILKGFKTSGQGCCDATIVSVGLLYLLPPREIAPLAWLSRVVARHGEVAVAAGLTIAVTVHNRSSWPVQVEIEPTGDYDEATKEEWRKTGWQG